MPEVYVGLGSNLEPRTHLRLAVKRLTEQFGAVRCSAVYSSPAAGDPAPDYWNLAAGFSTSIAHSTLVAFLAELERGAGRVRSPGAQVTLDADLLLYGRRVDAKLRVPRADVLRRPFVLAPLAELAPQLDHPVTGVRIGAAWRALERTRPTLERRGALSAV